MKKLNIYAILGMILGLCCTFTLTACGDDDDDDTVDDPLVGTWVLSFEEVNDNWYMKRTETLTINADGTFTWMMQHQQGEVGQEAEQGGEGEMQYGTYTVKDDVISCTVKGWKYYNPEEKKWEDEPAEQTWTNDYKFEISGNTLTIRYIFEDGMVREEGDTFTRK